MKISRNISIFLIVTILVFGTTISMGIPTSFAQAYEDSYAKDKKTSSLNKQKVNCNNIIINGVDRGSQGTKAGEDMLGAMAADEREDGTGLWIENGNDKKDSNSINENIVNFCKNKHNKIIVAEEEEEEEEEEPGTGTGTLSITKTVTCTPLSSGEPDPACSFMREAADPNFRIDPDEFTIEVTGNNPDPSSFAGSNTPVDVTLGVGQYEVSESPDASVDDAMENLEDAFPLIAIFGPIVTFSGDCTQQGSTGLGSIAEGDTQTCNIDNEFEVAKL
ncbi:MAG: hypothetical protein MRJ93_05140 [Nitrososphaeraceae archaeon]|nr:hypothetical protein [Nitrososphaeraceae archaeon]